MNALTQMIPSWVVVSCNDTNIKVTIPEKKMTKQLLQIRELIRVETQQKCLKKG